MQATINNLQKQFDIKKKMIAPEVRKGSLQTDKGTIFYVDAGTTTSMNKAELRKALITQLKLSPATADRIVKSSQATRLVQPYVKVVSTSSTNPKFVKKVAKTAIIGE
jgi:hypothetical protein